MTQSLGVLEAYHRSLVADGPVVAFPAKDVAEYLGCGGRRGSAVRGGDALRSRSQRLDPTGDGGHPQRAGGGVRPVQQFERAGLVLGTAPGQQHAGILVTGSGQERSGPEPVVGSDGRLEVVGRIRPPSHDGRQQAHVQ